MVRKGLRKALRGFPDEQRALLDEIQLADRAAAAWERERRRLVPAARIYDVKSGLWWEFRVERARTPRVVAEPFAELPDRTMGGKPGLIRRASWQGEALDIERGLTCDGLPHAVWTGGSVLKPDVKRYEELILRVHKLPGVLRAVYGVRVSVPELLEAVRAAEQRALLDGLTDDERQQLLAEG
jgi:hypothetical protein